MYHPTVGRFISRDPIGYHDGENPYGAYFVPNGVDPFGLANEKMWDNAINAASSWGVPTRLLEYGRGANIYNSKKEHSHYYKAYWDNLYLDPSAYKNLKDNTIKEVTLANLYNEAFHHYVDEWIYSDCDDCAWVRELMDNPIYIHAKGEPIRAMMEEAMSETISGVIFNLAAHGNNNWTRRRSISYEMSQDPQHTDKGMAFAAYANVPTLKKRADPDPWHNKRGPYDVLPRTEFILALWIMENGCNDPTQLSWIKKKSTFQNRIEALHAWYEYRWDPERPKAPDRKKIVQAIGWD
jgi:hypothetical protein